MDSFQSLDMTQLPPRECFHLALEDSSTSNDNYANTQRVDDTFNKRIMRDFHALYLTTDVLFVTQVFESLKTFGLENYSLHSSHYLSTGSLAFNALLKRSKIEL